MLTKGGGGGGVAERWHDDKGEGGVSIPPENDDVIYEQPLRHCCHLAFFLLIDHKRYLTILDLQNLAPEFVMTSTIFWPRSMSSLHLLGSQPHLHHIGLFGWGDIRRTWPLLDRVPAWLEKIHQQVGRGTWAGLCWQHTTQRYVCISIRRITGSF